MENNIKILECSNCRRLQCFSDNDKHLYCSFCGSRNIRELIFLPQTTHRMICKKCNKKIGKGTRKVYYVSSCSECRERLLRMRKRNKNTMWEEPHFLIRKKGEHYYGN